MRRTFADLVVALFFSGACARRPASPPPRTQPSCPSEATIEILHDAAFHLDQGDDDARVRQYLVDARGRTAADRAGAAWARAFVDRMESALRQEPGTRQFQAEVIRGDLHESPCLTKEMHTRFHLWLPPVGEPRT